MYAQAPQVPIVVLTGLDDETLAVKAVQEGTQDYLIKSQVEINLLVRAMRYAIERKRAEEALQRSQEQLHQGEKMKALGTLVAGVAHEINNPINLIMFNIPLLKKIWHDFQPVLKEHADREIDSRYGGLPYDFIEENLSQLLSDMEMAASRVAKIVTDLKNFARQSDVADKKPIQINMAVKNAMRLASTTLRKSGIHLKLNLGNNLPLMEANLQSIEQIVLNLIINAIEAINHDRGRVVVATGFQQKDKRIFISISDNGRGIDPSISDKLFDPFVTDRQTEGGTGLGLSITYKLVEAHDGEITFQSEKGKGTTFTVFFPTKLREKAAKILVVDDEASFRNLLTEALATDRPWLVDEACNGVEACIKLGTYRPDVLILDIFMPEMDGVEVCRTIKRERELSDIKVIITTGFPSHPEAFEGMVAADEAMALVFHQAEAAAPTDYNVLLTGESGTGKEMLARIIHTLSNRLDSPFLAVNMAASSKALFEDDFFGHTKGAYTGALTEKKGFFEVAQGGILFLDEITELEPALQGKLLRVIQEKELYRLGSTQVRNVNVRIIAATNRDIEKAVRKGLFRGDLFYRLNMFHIHIPPLRERKKDILPLAHHFLRKHAKKNQKEIDSLAPDLAERLLEYPFPGNVRELENIIASAVLWQKGRVLSLSSAHGLQSFSRPGRSQTDELLTLAEVEERHIRRILEITDGNRTRAAKILGIGLRTLQRKLKALDRPV
ncbi:MAG: hypothetical protein DRH17_11830 [Deltaproteobacteria bacterium]|nr:MAG: hypothetical protein DRH17_11830 [Deltaproteobacteria bacterium]